MTRSVIAHIRYACKLFTSYSLSPFYRLGTPGSVTWSKSNCRDQLQALTIASPGCGVEVSKSPDPSRGRRSRRGAGTTLPSVPGGVGRGRGGRRLLPRSKSGNKRVSPASPPAHSRTLALGRTRNRHRRRERASERRAGTHRAEPAKQPASRARDHPTRPSPAAAPRRPVSPRPPWPMALKRIQKVSGGDRPGAAGRASPPARTDPGRWSRETHREGTGWEGGSGRVPAPGDASRASGHWTGEEGDGAGPR